MENNTVTTTRFVYFIYPVKEELNISGLIYTIPVGTSDPS